MTKEKRIAVEKFVKSLKRRLIKPAPNETPAERRYRVESEILMRIERYGNAGPLSRDELYKWATLYFEVERQGG